MTMKYSLTILILLLLISLNISTVTKRIIVVGSGWGGIGCAKTILETQSNVEVILVDSLKDPTGFTPFLTPTGKPFEAGIRGFWYDYPNIYSVIENFLGLKQDDVFTPCTNSSFYSPYGLEATAPVFGDSFPLPSPLGQIFASAKLFERLPIVDRVTMIGLLYAMLDYDKDEESIKAYDRMNAHDLFVKFGLSKRLVDDFIKPTLLVGLFKPPEELSATVVMELLYYYALSHQNSFDVKWIKSKSIAETITFPLIDKLQKDYGLQVLGNSKVNKLIVKDNKISSIEYIKDDKKEVIENIDAVCLAVGASGLKGILRNSPEISFLSTQLSKASSLNSVSCISARIWLDRKISTRSPANVFSRFKELRGSGGTFFMLEQLQHETRLELWGGDESNMENSVIACDFYNSAALMSLSSEDIIQTLMNDLLPAAVPEFRNAKVIDSHVVKFGDAVSWFSPGSYDCRPSTLDSSIDNLVMAGDWVKLDRDTESKMAKGLCQERAYVTGMAAANAIIDMKILDNKSNKKGNIIPIREDEPQVKLGKFLNKRVMSFLKPFGLSSPWVR